MAKDRALRRAAREADRQRRIEAARLRNEENQKRQARRIAGQPSLLQQTRRRKARTAIFIALFMNALVWILSGEWSMRTIAFVVSALIAPMIAVLVVRSDD